MPKLPEIEFVLHENEANTRPSVAALGNLMQEVATRSSPGLGEVVTSARDADRVIVEPPAFGEPQKHLELNIKWYVVADAALSASERVRRL